MKRYLVGLLLVVPTLAFGMDWGPMESGPVLYFKNRLECMQPPPGPTGCHIPPYLHDPSVNWWPNLLPYTPLVSLRLPEGEYHVTAKLSAYPVGGALTVVFECALYDARYSNNQMDPAFPLNPGVDLASFDGPNHQTLYFQTPVSFHARGGTMTVGCKATGFKDQWFGDQNVDMFVWNVSISAIRVGTVVKG
jgi:hypothetical protein